MGLITKEVEVGLIGRNIKWYEDKGYIIPRRIDKNGKTRVKKGTKIIVRVEDLQNCSIVKVNVKCDSCNKELKPIKWMAYLKCVKEDGKYYCGKCSNKLYGIENRRLTRLQNSKSFEQWCYDNLSKEKAEFVLSKWDYDKNKINPKDVSYGSSGLNRKGYWFKCLDNSEHISEQKSISSFVNGGGSLNCTQCNTNVVANTHPNILHYFVNQDDIFIYSHGSGKKLPMKCPNCGYEKKMKIPILIRSGFSCPKCSDKIPYPEKFMFNVLEQLLNKDFQTQLSKTIFKWCKNWRYDFYINKINCIIETHGEQHYIENVKNNRKMSLREIQENDRLKEELANKNGIDKKHYIIINCRYSTLEWIKNSIMQSELPRLLNFKEEDIDWLKCHEYACNSLVKIVCDLWNSGIKNATKIANILRIGKTTIRRYLKQGVKLNWCSYDPKKSNKLNKDYNCKKIICLTNNDIFKSIVDASKKYNIPASSISAYCRSGLARNPSETGEKLIFMYYDEYILKTEQEIKNILNKIQVKPIIRKIICLTTNEIFDSILEASNKYNIDSSSITKCCKGKQKYAGKHPVTNEEMIWVYYEEYINNK